MPYEVQLQGGKRPWKIVKTDTGEVVGSSLTKEDAEKSIVARQMAEHGKKLTGEKSSK